jgi:MarR family transcriptional regulator, organic hydroperoxide resistance regulator
MDRVEDCISFLLSKAAQQISRRARDKLARWGVTPTQYAVLKVLWGGDGLSAAAVGGRLSVDSATITGVIDRLATADLLERKFSSEDRRVNQLFLTKRGRSLQALLDAAMDDLNQEVKSELEGQARAFWTGLRRLGEARD